MSDPVVLTGAASSIVALAKSQVDGSGALSPAALAEHQSTLSLPPQTPTSPLTLLVHNAVSCANSLFFEIADHHHHTKSDTESAQAPPPLAAPKAQNDAAARDLLLAVVQFAAAIALMICVYLSYSATRRRAREGIRVTAPLDVQLQEAIILQSTRQHSTGANTDEEEDDDDSSDVSE
jgi:hypothetical protein